MIPFAFDLAALQAQFVTLEFFSRVHNNHNIVLSTSDVLTHLQVAASLVDTLVS